MIANKMRSQDNITPQNIGDQHNNNNNNNNTNSQGPNWSKIQALMQRKIELEKILTDKNALLQQIQRQEAQIINGNCETLIEGSSASLRRKIGTSFKLPKNLANSKEGDVEKMILEKKIQQEIFNASYKLANDPNVSKSIRRGHKIEYEAAQQKLLAINHGLTQLKKRKQIKSNTMPSSSMNHDTPAITLNLTKSPSVQKQQQHHSSSSERYGSTNSVNNNYERRNSIKSMTMTSPKHSPDDRVHFDRTLKAHRSDYDLNRLIGGLPPGNLYMYDNYSTKQQQKVDHSESMNNTISDTAVGGYYKHRASTNIVPDAISYCPQQAYDDSVFLLKQSYGKKYAYDSTDSVSMSPSNGGGIEQLPQTGLGGYWRTLGNNERVWCTVDNSNYDSNSITYQQSGKLKKPMGNRTTPTKSFSLGNFDIITGKDELGDKISISSMNSENNKKPKEKQWLETSLDGPLIKAKIPPNIPHDHLPNITYHHHTLSPTLNTYTPTSLPHQHHHHSPHKHNSYRERSKLSSQSISSPNYHATTTTTTKLEDQSHFSQSTSMINTEPQIIHQHPYQFHQYQQQIKMAGPMQSLPLHNHHQQQQQQQQQQQLSQLSPTTNHLTTGSSTTINLMKPNRLQKAPDIRIESPKNMTVVQQAIFMPYKEVTKPFEMSDFYKYSTKYRQKECGTNVTPGIIAKPQHPPPPPTPIVGQVPVE